MLLPADGPPHSPPHPCPLPGAAHFPPLPHTGCSVTGQGSLRSVRLKTHFWLFCFCSSGRDPVNMEQKRRWKSRSGIHRTCPASSYRDITLVISFTVARAFRTRLNSRGCLFTFMCLMSPSSLFIYEAPAHLSCALSSPDTTRSSRHLALCK